MRRVLFVCTGNTCRSPMAEGILRHLAQKVGLDVEVQSAGTHAFEGSKASTHAEAVLSERGIPHEHHSKLVNKELLKWADIVLTMTHGHKAILLQYFPDYVEKIYTLKELAFGGEGWTQDIGDPFGGELDEYRETGKELEDAIRQLINRWIQEEKQ